MQQRFCTQPYAAFVPYGVYKGHLNEASTVVEAWLKKKKRTAGAMSSLWRTVDYRCKALADSFSVLPEVQRDAPAKLRVALWRAFNSISHQPLYELLNQYQVPPPTSSSHFTPLPPSTTISNHQWLYSPLIHNHHVDCGKGVLSSQSYSISIST